MSVFCKSLVLLLVTMIGVSEALRCYKCSNCDENEPGEVEECNEGYDVCLKMSFAGNVNKFCSKRAACSIATAEDVLRDAWNDISSNFQTGDQEYQECNITCNWPNEPLYGVHASDCTKYIQCTSSGPVEQTCLPGTRWYQEMLTCHHADATPCVAGCSKKGDVPEPRDNENTQNKITNCCSEDYCNGTETKVAAISTLIMFLTLSIFNYFL